MAKAGSRDGALGHGLSTSEVLPRRIEALAEVGRQFVAVPAGDYHSLALTEEGHVYGWGYGCANGHAQEQRTPQLVAALAGIRVLMVYAQGDSSCAITEKGELYAWGEGSFNSFNLGHGVVAPQYTPKLVEALRGVKVAAGAICANHSLVAGEDGVVWGFGQRAALGLLVEADAPPGDSEDEDSKDGVGDSVVKPTLTPNVRVRTLP